jgi:hypothetical protein
MKFLILSIIALVSLTNAFALSYQPISELDESYGQKIDLLIKNFDKKGFAYVKFTPKVISTLLPLTNTRIQRYERTETGLISMSKVDVYVFTTLETLPESFSNIVTKLVADYNVSPTFIKEAIEVPKKVIKEKKVIEKEKSFLPPLNYYVISGFVLFVFLFTLGSLNFGKQSKFIGNLLDSKLNQLNESLESSARVQAPAYSNNQEAQKKDYGQRASSISSNNISWVEYDLELITAILSDCYWSNEDSYAYYIWQQLSPKQKNSMIGSLPFMKDYAIYFIRKNPEDLSLIHDPYYFNPLKIEHISNEDLTTIVKKKASLYRALSELRKNNLQLSIKEKISIHNDKSTKVETYDFAKESASIPRFIKEDISFEIKSIEDEIEILNMKDELPGHIKKSILSLAWLLELKEEQVATILGKYSAKQLAEVWVGPEDVLIELEKNIPERKKNLMKTYLEKIVPDRKNPLFSLIVSESFEITNNIENDEEFHLKIAS